MSPSMMPSRPLIGDAVAHTPAEERILGRLKTGFKGSLLTWEPLSGHTTWRVGGPAAIFGTALDRDDLLLFLEAFRSENLPVLILGGGSNILVADDLLHLGVVRLAGEFLFAEVIPAAGPVPQGKGFARGEERAKARIVAGAGMKLSVLSRLAHENSLTGLEFAAQVPGTLGACLTINAGAFGQCLGDAVDTVNVLELAGNGWVERKERPSFSYRSSSILRDQVVLGATLALGSAPPEKIAALMRRQREERRERQPSGNSAGSVFVNPPGRQAGALIEEAGCKGWREGGAEVSPRHANFILNRGGATAQDIYRLISAVRDEVYKVHGLKLNLEVRLVGLPDLD